MEAAVGRFAVAKDASEAFRAVCVGSAHLSTASILADFVASALPVGLAVESAQSVVAELSDRAVVVVIAGDVLDAS